jgi:hypothetical protein
MARFDRNLEASELCEPEAAKKRITCKCVRMRSVKSTEASTRYNSAVAGERTSAQEIVLGAMKAPTLSKLHRLRRPPASTLHNACLYSRSAVVLITPCEATNCAPDPSMLQVHPKICCRLNTHTQSNVFLPRLTGGIARCISNHLRHVPAAPPMSLKTPI